MPLPSRYQNFAAPAAPFRKEHVGTYHCPELLPNTCRAGALDAFKLPSVALGVSTPPKHFTVKPWDTTDKASPIPKLLEPCIAPSD